MIGVAMITTNHHPTLQGCWGLWQFKFWVETWKFKLWIWLQLQFWLQLGLWHRQHFWNPGIKLWIFVLVLFWVESEKVRENS